MSYNITLSSSMRSNLLSLRNIATQMSKTQNILSTGKKVNNAIDNASSYYQARSLTHRAADLNSLLDSMSQGIQTIKAAVEGLERYDKFLEQATIIAEEAYEIQKELGPLEVTKEVIAERIGKNGALVSTLQELKNAVADENITDIYVYNDITLGSSDTIRLTGNKTLQAISSDITLTFNSSSTAITMYDNAELRNITIKSKGGGVYGGNITGNVNISTTGSTAHGCNNVKIHDANLIVTATGTSSYALEACTVTDSKVVALSDYGYALNNTNAYRSTLNISKTSIGTSYNAAIRCSLYDSVANVKTIGGSSYAFSGTDIVNSQVNAWSNSGTGYTISVKNVENSVIKAFNYAGQTLSQTTIDNSSNSKLYYANKNSKDMVLYGGDEKLDSKTFLDELTKTLDEAFVPEVVRYEELFEIPSINNDEYLNVLDQLDDMVEDSSYQGVNLLKGDELNIVFNEDRSHNFVIKGIDMRSLSAGIVTRDWKTKENITVAINELRETLNKVRSVASELGNKLSIIQTRQTFTDAVIDILEEGTDKLTLADMNEVSAEYLVLQTRQQLAVNSLSLASQSSGSILGLFG